MITSPQHLSTSPTADTSGRKATPLSRTGRVLWTAGNLLMLAGAYILLYIGGVYALAEHNRIAARGDSDLPAPAAVAHMAAPNVDPLSFIAPVAEAFVAPVLNTTQQNEGQVVSSIPSSEQGDRPNTVTRVVIPSINVDSKVVQVGWEVQEQNGQQVAIWDVAEYAVGHHKGSFNPGEGGNVVLAGHVGGYGKVFKDLYYVKPGDQITLYSNGEQYLYVVQDHIVVQEEGVPYEQQVENARYIGPTDSEAVTMITCWPAKGNDRFTQRVVIRAVPFGATKIAQDGIQSVGPEAWTLR